MLAVPWMWNAPPRLVPVLAGDAVLEGCETFRDWGSSGGSGAPLEEAGASLEEAGLLWKAVGLLWRKSITRGRAWDFIPGHIFGPSLLPVLPKCERIRFPAPHSWFKKGTSCNHAFPSTVECTLKLWAPKPFLDFLSNIGHSHKKWMQHSTEDYQTVCPNQCSWEELVRTPTVGSIKCF